MQTRATPDSGVPEPQIESASNSVRSVRREPSVCVSIRHGVKLQEYQYDPVDRFFGLRSFHRLLSTAA